MNENISKQDNSFNHEIADYHSELNNENNCIEMFESLVQSKNLKILMDLRSAILKRDFENFKLLINREENFHKILSLKPRLINDILVYCLIIAKKYEFNSTLSYNKDIIPCDGCEFIEYLMHKLNQDRNHSLCCDDTCKSIVKVYIQQKRQLTENSITFLLRCNDINLIKQVFDYDLVELNCCGSCINWHLMFITTYQERFFTNSFEKTFENFMARYILLSKLRCLLLNKRSFLTWFAGALHLYVDDYFIQNEEIKYKQLLSKLFEGLIINGLLNYAEFKNLYQMLIKRSDEMVITINSFNGTNENSNIRSFEQSVESIESETIQKTITINSKSKNICYFSNLEFLFPLSLKNICRLTIKREIREFTRKSVYSLPLPNNLKRFIFFENECDVIFKNFSLVK